MTGRGVPTRGDALQMGGLHYGRARRAGTFATWGNSVKVATGAALPAFELLRASLDVPLVWRVTIWAVGTNVLDVGDFVVSPGLGRVHIQTPRRQQVPGATETSVEVPARELVVTVALAPATANADVQFVAVACPLTWPGLPQLPPTLDRT
jgi:hypothetical protein